jgi:hypothetical protein
MNKTTPHLIVVKKLSPNGHIPKILVMALLVDNVLGMQLLSLQISSPILMNQPNQEYLDEMRISGVLTLKQLDLKLGPSLLQDQLSFIVDLDLQQVT